MTDKVFEGRMRSNPYQTYVEDEILTADPIRLVQLMYEGAIESVDSARSSLARGDIKARSGSLTKAVAILAELSFSLDHTKGGDLSERLDALYDYMQKRLIEANQKQIDAPLSEVTKLLQTLSEAWMGIKTPPSVQAPRPEVRLSETTYSGLVPEGYVPLNVSY